VWQIHFLEAAHNVATEPAVSDSRKCKPKLNHLPEAVLHWEETHVPIMQGRKVHSDPEYNKIYNHYKIFHTATR
jgi:hypothetical protein